MATFKQVWSASSGTKHKPPTDLVMKSSDWSAGTNSITTLHNSEGDVSAIYYKCWWTSMDIFNGIVHYKSYL